MISKKVKIAGIGLGVILIGFFLYKYFKKGKNDNGRSVGSILKDAFDNLSFQFNSYKIDSDSYPFLDELASVLLAETSWKLELAGHTDNVGSEATNLAMSKGRVEEVRKYLVSKGVPVERITTFAYGESKPITTNDTEEGRAKNRRVEMKIIKSDGTALNIEDKSTLIDVEKKEVVSKDKPKTTTKPKTNSTSSNVNQGSNKPNNTPAKPKVNPNRAKAITIKGVKIYVSDDGRGRLVFEDGSKIGEYKVNAKVTLLGVTAWSGSVAVAKIFKYSNGSVKIVDNTGKDFDGEDTDLVPLVNQFKEGKKNLIASIGKANLNLQKMA